MYKQARQAELCQPSLEAGSQYEQGCTLAQRLNPIGT